MVGFRRNHIYPIGVHMGDDALTIVQMANGHNALNLLAYYSIQYPEATKCSSSSWQKWAIEVINQSIAFGQFHGKTIIAAMSPSEVFIDTIKMSKVPEHEFKTAILDYLSPKLKITPDNIIMEHFKTDSENVLVIGTDRTKLYRHLAVYERAHLKVASISVWPFAIMKAYACLWIKRKNQNEDPVMLLDIGKSCANIVICDSKKLYFARSAPVGAKNLDTDRMIDLLNSEMDMCRVRFRSLYNKPPVNQIIFVSGYAVDKDICTKIAKRAQMSAQIGDCLETVKASLPDGTGPSRHRASATWMTAIGLSLS